jgi:flavodoxin/NAD-dependent dihydropyrimidine dehydrogenase PreA subunit
MHVVLIYFSQTGNTRKVANIMTDAFREFGHSARAIPLNESTPEDATQGDLLGVGTPCYSSQAPTPVKAFLRSLPPLKEKKTFVFATSGGAPGRVLYDLTSLLRRGGADVLGGFVTRGQVSHPAPHMVGQFPGRPCEVDLNHARDFTKALVDHVSKNRKGPLSESRPDALKLGLGIYDLMGWIISDEVSRILMPEPKADPVKCDKCRWCVLECPMDNIIMDKLPILGDRCIRCYHCMIGCPQDAFDADWRFADPFLMLLYNATFMRWFGDLKPNDQLY